MLPNSTCAALNSSSFTAACVTAIALVTGSACVAQVAGGTISGSVRDSSGRAIAGAQVAVKNSETAIVESQGGRIWANGGGVGATFHFTLPAAPAERHPPVDAA